MALIRTLLKAAALVAAAWLSGACISENATAVDGTKPCSGVDCLLDGAGGRLADSSAIDEGISGTGGSAGSDGDVTDGSDIPIYTLVVDAPDDHTTLGGIVIVTGRAPGFLNVEVWDSLHKHPPLAQTPPNPDGTFQTSVDTGLLAPGGTAWTVFAWDSPPNQPFTHSASVTLHLTLEPPL